MKIIDLSVPLKNESNEPTPYSISYAEHVASGKKFAENLGLSVTDLPNGMFSASERLDVGSHCGTHMDSPYHFGPLTAGKPAKTIDVVPLEWCYGDGVILDFRHKKKGELITEEDVKAALAKIKYTIKKGDIVLIMTGADKHYGEAEYWEIHPGMSREATSWLIDQGVKIMGTDAWGWDRPFSVMLEEYKNGVKGKFWAAHYLGKEKEYCHIEKLANLDKIPKPYGFKVAAFPVKIEKASAGWVRPVAILD